MQEDPWEHRSANMSCATCMWFIVKSVPLPVKQEPIAPGMIMFFDNPKVIGRCRRHAPTISGYPVVFNSDWCGDHKLDETKI